MKDQVYAYILNEGELGATAYELELAFGKNVFPEIEALYFDGLIDPGEIRDHQIAWRTHV